MNFLRFCRSINPRSAVDGVIAFSPLMIQLTRLLIILLAFVTTAVAQERKARVVLIGTPLDHPPRSHMYLHECGVLEKCLRQTPGIETVTSEGWPKDAALLEGVTCVVLYSNPGGNIVLAPENRPAAQKLFDAGCGFVAIHWSTDCAVEVGQDYLKLLGGRANESIPSDLPRVARL
jgi:hypothetical protein